MGVHVLAGNFAGRYAVSVSGNWWLTFGFDGEGAALIDCKIIIRMNTA
jgi:proteic killer suppression protein